MGDKYYAGESPTLALLRRGSIVVLVSKITGKSLRIHPNETVDAHGGEGEWAQFIVHIRGNGVVALQNAFSPDKWIHVRDNQLNGKGEGGKFTEFKVEDHDGFVTFESVNYPGQHIGISSDGSPQAPNITGVGQHAMFSVKVKEEVAEWILPSRSPLKRPFAHGNVTVLESKASGKTLRLRDDNEIDVLGGEGDWARWIVHVTGRKEVAFQHFHQRNRWLRISEGGSLNADGTGGVWCRFRVKKFDGYVVFESVNFPGKHIRIGPLKPGHVETGAGDHSQFRPKVKEQHPQYNGVRSFPLMSILVHGNEILLYSRASKKTLRIRGDNGVVDGDGGEGEWDNHLVFESVGRPASHVGILSNGTAKDPQSTGHGEHGQFWPKVKSASPYLTYIAGRAGASSLIVDGKKMLLISKASGRAPCFPDEVTIDASGGYEGSRLKADVRRPGIVSFESAVFKDKWLAINNDQVLVGQGGFYTQFRVKAIGEYVALESHVFEGHHVGVLEDGSLKPPSKTGTGDHGQFLPKPI